jgi:hypothetical protein
MNIFYFSDERSEKLRESVGKMSGIKFATCREGETVNILNLVTLIGITDRSVGRNIQKLQSNGLLQSVDGKNEDYWVVLE